VKKFRMLGAATALATLAGGHGALAEGVQTDGTLNVITYYRTLDATTWDYMKWSWKGNHDGLQLDHLLAGDLQKGPRGTGDNSFVAQAYIPYEHLKGELAESWEVKEDPLRIEFKLREGVFWPAKEGVMERRELVADDVVKSFASMAASERMIPTYWDFVKEWKAEGDHTVVAYLDHFNGNWGYRIGWGYYDQILPPEWFALSEEARADWRNATGTGPYKVADVVQSSRHVYEANEDYWNTATIDGEEHQLPLNKQVIYHIIKDEASAIAALRSGKADIMESIRWQFVDELKRTAPELKIEPFTATVGTYIALRNDVKPFDDVRVRKAMNLAVNQPEIMAALTNDGGSLLNWPFAERWSSLYTPVEELSEGAQEYFGYHPEKARALLDEAGVPEGFEFEVMVCSCNPYHMDMIPILQAYYDRIGVKMVPRTLEYGAFRSMMRDPEMSAGYLMDNGSGNPFSVLRKAFVDGQTWNASMYSDAKFDEMWNAALAELDLDKQQRMLKNANRYLIEEAVAQVWLPTTELYRAWWPWVKNYHGELRVGAVRPGPIYAQAWIDQDMKKEMGY
jgi:peptide/nickel transport system substrate-binding protein